MNNLCQINTEQNPAGAFQIKSNASNLYLAGTYIKHIPYARHYKPLLIWDRSWILSQVRILQNKAKGGFGLQVRDGDFIEFEFKTWH